MDWERDGITRRAALTRGFGGIALVCSFDFDKVTRTQRQARRPRSRARRRPARSSRSSATCRSRRSRGRSAPRPTARSSTRFTMKAGKAEILPGLETPVLGYNGLFPGPTIRAKRGKPIEVRQINESGRELNVHLHGGVTEPQFDGHPHDAIPNGTERLYKYPNVQHSATLWYHDHAHGETAKTLFAGLAAFYILDDPDDKQFDLPQGDYDVPLMLTDRSFNVDGSFRYRTDLDRGFRGDTILVNGAVAPRMKVERRLYRLPLPQRRQRARLRARAGQRAQDGPDRLRRRPAAGAGGAALDPDGAGRARRRDRRLPPVRRRLEGDPAQHDRRAVDERGDALRHRPRRRRGGADPEEAARATRSSRRSTRSARGR